VQDVFDFRNRLIDEYSAFSRSFSKIAAADLAAKVDDEYERGRYWPEPLIQINPNYKRSGTVHVVCHCGKDLALWGAGPAGMLNDEATHGHPHHRPTA